MLVTSAIASALLASQFFETEFLEAASLSLTLVFMAAGAASAALGDQSASLRPTPT